MLSESMSKYATENVLSQFVQRVGNNGIGATQSTYKLQRAIFWGCGMGKLGNGGKRGGGGHGGKWGEV